MTERKPHPDNELIEEMNEFAAPSQQSFSGGEVNRRVGSHAELNRATDPANREPVTGGDNPGEDAKKGDGTIAAIQKNRES